MKVLTDQSKRDTSHFTSREMTAQNRRKIGTKTKLGGYIEKY